MNNTTKIYNNKVYQGLLKEAILSISSSIITVLPPNLYELDITKFNISSQDRDRESILYYNSYPIYNFFRGDVYRPYTLNATIYNYYLEHTTNNLSN